MEKDTIREVTELFENIVDKNALNGKDLSIYVRLNPEQASVMEEVLKNEELMSKCEIFLEGNYLYKVEIKNKPDVYVPVDLEEMMPVIAWVFPDLKQFVKGIYMCPEDKTQKSFMLKVDDTDCSRFAKLVAKNELVGSVFKVDYYDPNLYMFTFLAE